MKFHVDSYHFKLLRDYERLAVFKEAIDEFADDLDNSIAPDSNDSNNQTLAYDLGCGSGVLSYFASSHFDKVVSIEISPAAFKLAKENLKDFDNIEIHNQDALDFDFSNYPKADLIVCEMLDTALIDEEEVPVLNHARKYLKKDGKIIPQGIINSAEPVFMNIDYLQYEDDEFQPVYDILGKPVIFSQFDFLEGIEENFSCIIQFEINGNPDKKTNTSKDKIKVNGIKLTSFAKLNDNIICGPTPMLNPSMLVPFEERELNIGDRIKVRLSYVMGGGVETIKTEVLELISFSK